MPTIWVAYGCWAISARDHDPRHPGGGHRRRGPIGLLTTFGWTTAPPRPPTRLAGRLYIPQMAIGLIAIFYWRWDINRRRKKAAQAEAAPA